MRALRRLLSPTLGVNRSEPVLAWLLRDALWLTEAGRIRRTGLWTLTLAFLAGALAGALLVRFNANAWFALALIASRFVLDGLTIARSWGRLGLEFRTGRWDALRLTAQTEGAILRAHYAAACAGVWRPMLAVLGLQTGMLLIIGLSSAAMMPDPLTSLWVFSLSLGLIFVFGIDLPLRSRAVAALGLALSASAPRAGLAAILGGVALIGFWIAQIAALFVGVFLSSILAIFPAGELAASLVYSLSVAAAFLPPLLVAVFTQRVALFRLASAVAARDAAT